MQIATSGVARRRQVAKPMLQHRCKLQRVATKVQPHFFGTGILYPPKPSTTPISFQRISRPNLDALTVPEALVNTRLCGHALPCARMCSRLSDDRPWAVLGWPRDCPRLAPRLSQDRPSAMAPSPRDCPGFAPLLSHDRTQVADPK